MQHARYYRHDVRGSKNKHTLYLGAAEKVYTTTGGIHSFEYKFYIGNIVITESTNNSESQENYLHKDHLGSPVTITDKTGLVVQRTVYDPWGKSSSISGGYTGTSNLFESRTFTGHESIDDLNIIHMNGRIYEPTLGRFLQSDPFIQAPTNGQSYNRFAYVLNNPLSRTDPTGYISIGKALESLARPFKHAVRTVMRKIGPIGSTLLTLAVCGGSPICVAVMSYDQARAFGASPSQAFKSGAIAFATANVFEYIGAQFNGAEGSWNVQGGPAHIAAHAITGGVIADLQGGKFGHGFWSAGITKGLNVNGIVGTTQGIGWDALRIVVAAAIGGTVSELTGGKFANGAATAAFAQAFNGNSAAKRIEQRKQLEQRKIDFEARMREIVASGHAGIGHKLTYDEAIWLWQNGNGTPITVDGRALTTDNWMSKLSGLSIVGPDIFDDVRVHGQEGLNSLGQITDSVYDWDLKPWSSHWMMPVRNTLTIIGRFQNGDGQAFEIRYRYDDEYFKN